MSDQLVAAYRKARVLHYEMIDLMCKKDKAIVNGDEPQIKALNSKMWKLQEPLSQAEHEIRMMIWSEKATAKAKKQPSRSTA